MNRKVVRAIERIEARLEEMRSKGGVKKSDDNEGNE